MLSRAGRRRLAIGVVAIVAAMIPRHDLERLPTVCPVRLVTGYPCPTCGMTRSWHSVARLDPIRAMRDHPFGPLVLGVIVTGAWSPVRADAIVARTGRLPARVKAGAVFAWLGWWLLQLRAMRRARRVPG